MYNLENNCLMPKYLRPALLVLLWLLLAALVGTEFRQSKWECLLVIFATVELVPRGLWLMHRPQPRWFGIMGIWFCVAYFLEGFWLLALPYFLASVWLTFKEAALLFAAKKFDLQSLVRLFALGFWATGVGFAVMFMAQFSPLDFDPVIVSLTAAHFHLAGFVLAVLVYCRLETFPSRLSNGLGWATLLGMPLVAAGITLTKLGFSPLIEQTTALGFVVFALMIIGLQTQDGLKAPFALPVRQMWLLGALCLLVGVSLAAAYALRFQWAIAWVSIPNMKIWHGTLNTLGFASLSFWAWSHYREGNMANNETPEQPLSASYQSPYL